MNKFKRKSLYLALAAGLGATGVAGTASAVNVNPNGLGEVLIYPYYTVRNDLATVISITNTTSQAKAVKVRFTEGKNSREVLDFNLYMSAEDMWTGAVVSTTNGAKVITNDKSCTAPALVNTAGADFRNSFYSGTTTEGILNSITSTANGDGETTSLDRTREGYFEIIEMGTITDTAVLDAITHSSGVPGNCGFVQTASMNMGTQGNHPLSAPSGGLAGNASLINVAAGTDFGYDPTVLDNFSDVNIWQAPGNIEPSLRSASPAVSTVFENDSVYVSDWTLFPTGAEAAGAVLMHDNVINDYVLDAATLSGTDWVVTMPTKRYHVPVDDPSTGSSYAAEAPFTSNFWLGGACEEVTLAYWDREEQAVTSGVDFSPSLPTGNSLCWEANVVTFNDSDLSDGTTVLGSMNSVNIPVNYENGWARISFNGALNQLEGAPTTVDNAFMGTYSGTGITYYGLPVVGFMVQDFVNQNAAPGVMATYGGNFNHKTTTNVTNPNMF